MVRALAAMGCALLLLCGCSPDPATPGASSVTPTPSPSQTPEDIDLTEPGNARRAVSELSAQAAGNPVIRLTVNETTATMTWVADEQAVSYSWVGGVLRELDSDVKWFDQATFNPDDFALDDLGWLFTQAAAVSKSDAGQELQINEYNEGRVLMTVTTSPESQTVFFRHDGTLIKELDFTSASAVAEALNDTAEDSVAVLSIGLSDQGFWAEVAVSKEVVERRIRPADLPMYVTQHNQTSTLMPFPPTRVDTGILANLIDELARTYELVGTKGLTFVIDNSTTYGDPTIKFSVGGKTLFYNLQGEDITEALA